MARLRGPAFEIAASDRILEELQEAMAVAPRKAQKGALRALRRSIRTGKSAASTEIRSVINLPKKVVDRRIIATVLSKGQLRARVRVVDRRIELVEFLTKAQIRNTYARQRAQRARSGRRGRRMAGVSVKVYKSGGRQVYPGTFLELGTKSRNWHVLKREEGVGRYPIYIQFGPNLIDDFLKSFPRFAARANEVLERNVINELRFVLGDFRG